MGRKLEGRNQKLGFGRAKKDSSHPQADPHRRSEAGRKNRPAPFGMTGWWVAEGGLGDGEVFGEGLDAAEAFVFHGFGGGELAVNVGFGAGASGMEHAALADAGATGGTRYRRKLV